MKKLLWTLLISAPLWAQVIDPPSISWQNATENTDGTPLTDLDGTVLTCLDASGNPQFTFDVQDPTITAIDVLAELQTIVGIQYHCTAHHYDTSGNVSDPSGEISWEVSDQVRPKPPTGLVAQ
jgi:hypothetical protein